ncbi:YbaB/EbfC family nucleoid-associated protein [Elioraea sp. Yellowstone]|jgi:DNA-binding YbaB/EbfC family protein|uniref:YbaB/EbfC family nucleoid-associated protein n=1 Tax=Elioraea sp. Yellowstone TaxID=2592070 RepID=UPI001152E12D|nr:YbaB/EbfC family nucleoid-associated protein [Elioraea sp. Yellowstone]TQF76553.1 YbaB/EbfC family nucleoid-associated protein [Elioraea sp. Yellowstone]
MKNLGQMMKQAQAMQSRMEEMQARLGTLEVEGSAGGGMVRVTMSGKAEVRRVKIDRTLVDPDEVEVLEDLVVAAIADAKGKAEALVAEEMAKVTSGLQLPPGLKLPF